MLTITDPSPATLRPAAGTPAFPTMSRPGPDLSLLRKLIGLYIALWVFEGALRKWILPGLSNPLLVVRDPVLLVIYALALARGVFPGGLLILWTGVLSALAFGVSFVSTEVPIFVQAYGWRADFLHLPLIFLMVKVIDRDAVREIGKWFLICSVPMAVLVTLQFLSPGGGFFNRGAGGSEDSMLESAFGHIRPSGTFSFTNGLTGFLSLVAAFFLHHLLERKVYNRWIWLASAPPLAMMLVLSGSRASIGQVGLIVVSVLLICVVKPRYVGPAMGLIALGVLAIVGLGSLTIFREGMDVFAYRFGDSEDVRTGFFQRAIDSLIDPYGFIGTVPLGGVGLGVGTNAGATMLTGKRVFLVAEGEWPRVLIESGPVVGSLFILLRISIVTSLGFASLRSLLTTGNTLPTLIFAGDFVQILQGQFAQPSGLGFATIAGALCLAACRMPLAAKEVAEAPQAAPAPMARGMAKLSLGREPTNLPGETPTAPTPVIEPAPAAAPPPPPSPVGRRGRSLYAERLHGPGDDGK